MTYCDVLEKDKCKVMRKGMVYRVLLSLFLTHNDL